MLRYLGQSEFGLFSLVNTTIAYFIVLDFGLGTAIIRYTAKYRAEEEKAKEEILHGMFLVFYMIIGAIAFLLAIVLILNINRLFSNSLTADELNTSRKLMFLAAINLALSFPFSLYSSIVTAYERFIFAQGLQIVRMVINYLAMVGVLIIGYKAFGLILATTICNILYSLCNLFYCTRCLKIKMRFKPFAKTNLLREIGIYSFFIFLSMIVDRLFWSTGQFLIGIIVGATSVAVFALSMQFITAFYMPISAAVSSLFLPKVTKISIRDSGNRELSDLFIRVGRIQFIILAFFLSGFILYGQQFINLWAGSDYSKSYLITLIVIIPLTVPLIQNLGISILQAKNKHAFRSILYLVIAILNVLISIPIIKIWGPIGCAIGTAISFTIAHVVIMNFYYKFQLKLEIGKYWIEIVRIFPGVMLAFFFGLLFLQVYSAERPPGFVLNIIIYSAVYGIIVFFLGMNRFEKHIVLTFAGRIVTIVRPIRGLE